MRPPAWLVVVLVGALAGLVFAGISTYDFTQHLDRQVHNIHCSFIPGAAASTGSSGCQVAMMSPYSSVFRTMVWGGIPISLPAMAVFAFLGFFGLDLLLSRRKTCPRATGFLALATGVPAIASIVMATISLTKLGTACKLCVGIYLASALCVVGAIVLWRQAVRATGGEAIGASRDGSSRLELSVEAPGTSYGFLGGVFGIGVAFVLVPVLLYVVLAPDHGKFVGTCDALAKPADTYGVMIQLDRGGTSAAQAIEILDPLCPACRAFENRLAASGLADRLDRKAVLFPLDNSCNWMITETTHPGACTVSEAVLCAGPRAPEVIAWSFAEQETIREATKADPAAAARLVKARFPELASCVGSPEAKSRLNKSLRWSVANNIRVLTPQLFVDNVKLCDEDVDLGLEYALSIMLDRHAKGTLSPVPLEAPPAAAAPADHGAPTTAKPVEAARSGAATGDPTAPRVKDPGEKSPIDQATAPPGTSTAPPSTGTAPPGTSTGTAPPSTGTAPPSTGTAPPSTGTAPPSTGTSAPPATTPPAPDQPVTSPSQTPADPPAAPAEGGTP